MKAEAGSLQVRLARSGEGIAVRLSAPATTDVSAMFAGRTVEEAAALAPLLWNMCASAQEAAARSALGLPPAEGSAARVAAEILAEHVFRLTLAVPVSLGLPPRPDVVREARLAPACAGTAAHLAGRLFAPFERCPTDLSAFDRLVAARESVVAPTFQALADWPAAWGVADLPPLPVAVLAAATRAPDPVGAVGPRENDPATRLCGDPLLSGLAARHGRGPIFRLAARLVEAGRILDDLAEHRPPRSALAAPGLAFAARGIMAVRATVEDGRVREMVRLSPTDVALAPGGVVERALSSLPADLPDEALTGLAGAVLAIADPCLPFHVEVGHA